MHQLNSKTRLWLIGWATVLRERLVSGDPSAIPNDYPAFEEYAQSGARRSGPSNVAGILEVFLSVESAIYPEEVLLRAALEAKYVFGAGSVVTKYVYDLPDGESVEIDADAVTGKPIQMEPVRYLHCRTIEEESYQLSCGVREVLPKLPMKSRLLLDQTASFLGTTPIRMLQGAAQRFERYTLPKRLGW